ncbi:hypothetical protein PENSOL_c002G00173 [Penicillium solitum]|uniref:Major facilitator superfamily (MFS) profile domain-containing protein n=1 Tax=Penicillium solitum TaxID=60172 RepID=A0A1V6RLW0_9EURO|nr:uncharacterized protein PENSOL_c002G00173 [Penicillium solitum]OQE02518.1 hypothetical protein PENSOL_c002G00173 [Penicillium solitum]
MEQHKPSQIKQGEGCNLTSEPPSSAIKMKDTGSTPQEVEEGTTERLDPYAIFYSFMLIYSTTIYIPVTLDLQAQFRAPYTAIAWSVAMPSLGISLSMLLAKPFADSYGRRIVLLVSASIAILASGCASIRSINLSGFMASRFFQGIGTGPGLNVGLAILGDISWGHERGFRIGLWVMGTTIGAPVGILIGGLLGEVNQFWASYHLTILYFILLVLIIVTLPETLYPRDLMVSQTSMCLADNTTTPNHQIAEIQRTREIRVWTVKRIPGVKHAPFWAGMLRYLQVWTYPNVSIGCLSVVFFQYWWCNSLMIMAPDAYFMYSTKVQGALFVAFMLGSIFGEVFMSGRLSDWIVGTLVKKNNKRNPALRLLLSYAAALMTGVGYALWGVSIDQEWHWMTGEVALFLVGAGIQIGNTAMSSFIVDLYPEHLMDVISFYSVLFNLASFIEPWFISNWVASSGNKTHLDTSGALSFKD